MNRAVLATAFLVFGCSHATSVEKPDEGGESNGAKAAQPAMKEGAVAAKPRAARRPQRPGRPPLAASPGALFLPGGIEKLQNALADRGYLDLDEVHEGDIDEATSAAVRKFQSDEGIARTGNPDHETLRRLGLDPDSILRKSSAAKER